LAGGRGVGKNTLTSTYLPTATSNRHSQFWANSCCLVPTECTSSGSSSPRPGRDMASSFPGTAGLDQDEGRDHERRRCGRKVDFAPSTQRKLCRDGYSWHQCLSQRRDLRPAATQHPTSS
jgi:hypothetical protein